MTSTKKKVYVGLGIVISIVLLLFLFRDINCNKTGLNPSHNA